MQTTQHRAGAKNAASVAAGLALLFFANIFCFHPYILFSQTKYSVKNVMDGGTISGSVTLTGISPVIAYLDVSQDNMTCGKKKISPRLALGNNHGVENAIVYLEGVTGGKPFPSNKSYELAQHNCKYQPHVIMVPQGEKLFIVNKDAILHNVHSYELAHDLKTCFNIAQPIKGVRSCTKALMNPGILTATCDAGHPWMSAYILVSPNPYSAITDKEGKFTLDNIPSGTYTLHMWHEGVSIVKKEMEHEKVKKYDFEPPYEETKQVTVLPKSTSKIDFVFSLR